MVRSTHRVGGALHGLGTHATWASSSGNEAAQQQPSERLHFDDHIPMSSNSRLGSGFSAQNPMRRDRTSDLGTELTVLGARPSNEEKGKDGSDEEDDSNAVRVARVRRVSSRRESMTARTLNALGGIIGGQWGRATFEEEDITSYPDDALWPDDMRGIHPTRAKLMLVERTWKDELNAAIMGRENIFAQDVVGEDDPDNVNIAPELDEHDSRHLMYTRGHQFGHSKDENVRQLERAAFLVLEDIRNRMTKEMQMLGAYKKLLGYIFSMFCLFAVVSLQWGMGSADQRLFSVVSDQLFTVNTGTKNYNEEVESSGFSKTDITDWLSTNVLDNIFVADTCGDGLCTYPDEYPYFQGSDEMREFVGCETDCGSALTKAVTVNFYDPWKLKAAYDQVTSAVNNGWNSGDGSGLLEASEYEGHDTSPAAGWNICSRNLKELGFFETVCMFDGDVFIDGLPYRTAELEDGGDSFGDSYSFDLFNGLWELRIAFSGFSWAYGGVEVPIAFPAVRGEICVEGNEGDDNLRDSASVCKTWDPCPVAHNCSCEWWQDGTYYCFEPGYFNKWDQKYYGYAQQQNLIYLAEWLGFNDTYASTSTLNASRLDDDQWSSWACKGSGTHTISLSVATNPNSTEYAVDDGYDLGWDGYTFELYEVSSDDDSYTLVMSTSPTSGLKNEVGQYMCPEQSYAVSVVEPTVVLATDPLVIWTMTDTVGEAIATGVGAVSYCSVYGSAGTSAYCQNSPTFKPSPEPTVIPETMYIKDYFESFNSDIWDKRCGACAYSNAGLKVVGNAFQRTVGTALPRKIEAIVKFATGDNPFVVLTTSSDYDWDWNYEVGTVKLGIRDSYKFIKGQTRKASCYCPVSTSDIRVTFTIEISSTTITFTDDTCSGLSVVDDDSETSCEATLALKDDIGASSVYTMIGAAGVFQPSSEPTFAPTDTPAPSVPPTSSAPTITPLPTRKPTPVPYPVPTTLAPTHSIAPTTQYPECDFDSGYCTFENTGSYDWTRAQKSTYAQTGPPGAVGDHTSGSGYYAYVDSSSPNYPNVGPFVLESEAFKEGASYVSFWYNMYGGGMVSVRHRSFRNCHINFLGISRSILFASFHRELFNSTPTIPVLTAMVTSEFQMPHAVSSSRTHLCARLLQILWAIRMRA